MSCFLVVRYRFGWLFWFLRDWGGSLSSSLNNLGVDDVATP
jgi:hypothetical protein